MPALIRRPKGHGNRHIARGARGIKKSPLERGWTHVIVCASGPSFSTEQAQMVQTAQTLGWRVIVTNTTYQKVPTADVLYAGDRPWWEEHLPGVLDEFKGEFWTINRWIAHAWGLCHVEHSDERGLSPVGGRIHTGGNAGYAAIGLAYLFGARKILLVGFDFQDTYGMSHWHGDHPKTLNQDRPYKGWLERLPKLIDGLKDVGVEVINCTIETAIPRDVVPRGDLAQCLSS